MVTFSDCKINIGLNVVRRRPDGYHDIETCMIPVPWYDIIEIIPAEGTETTLTVLGNHVDCPTEKNLVMKAYRKMCQHVDLPAVDIILQKIIPDGAGLGGGSADAAHTLTMLNTMYDCGFSDKALADMASGIGADCPFFVYDRPMIARGIGEVLTPVTLSLKGYTILVAKPSGVNISTKEAYAGITPSIPDAKLEDLLSLPVEEWMGCIKNDFEKSIFKLAPQIAQLKEYMLASGAVYASMSGSGASVYGIFKSDKLAEEALDGLTDMPHFMFKVD